MKHWHFMAKIYESANMQLINISSGVISTPNSMSATDTINYLSKMVADQQKQKPGPEEVTIAFEAFCLVESDDTEPAAPLTDEDIAQHRHDDKVDAMAMASGTGGDTRLAEALDMYDRWNATTPKVAEE